MGIFFCELAKGKIINLSTVYYSVTPNPKKYLPITMTFTKKNSSSKKRTSKL